MPIYKNESFWFYLFFFKWYFKMNQINQNNKNNHILTDSNETLTIMQLSNALRMVQSKITKK